MHAGGPGRLPLVNLSWTDTWNDLLARASSVVGLDPGVLWPALAILLIVLVWAPARRWGRTLVTIVHEAGHAAVGLMVGRRFLGFVVSRDLSGHAVTAGKPTGPGRVATSWAGYPAPAVLGAVVVLLALKGWASAVLLLGLVLLAVLLVMSRSVRTVLLVLLVAVLTGPAEGDGPSGQGEQRLAVYAHENLGTVASLGIGKGVARIMGQNLRGFTAWTAHRGYHVYAMPTLNRKVRIMMDWFAAVVFRRDLASFGSVAAPGAAFAQATRNDAKIASRKKS